MNKKLLISFLSVLIFSSVSVMADDTTTTTDARPQPPQFENGTPPDFTKGQGIKDGVNMANPPRNFKDGQNGQFDGRRPSKKPDSKPGGDRTPPDWDSSSNGQIFQDSQSPQFNGSNLKDRQPKPPKEKNSTSSTES